MYWSHYFRNASLVNGGLILGLILKGSISMQMKELRVPLLGKFSDILLQWGFINKQGLKIMIMTTIL